MLVWSVAVLLCLHTVQRADFWGAIIALQSYWPCQLGIDNVNVARTSGKLLDHGCLVKPLPLVKDGDLVALMQYMIQARVGIRFGSRRLKGMLLMKTLSRVVFG